LYFSYVGGPVFNLGSGERSNVAASSAPAPEGPEPADADGFSRRAQVAAARRDYARAVADLSRAIALDPKQPRYLAQRAMAYLGDRRSDLAMLDVDQGLKLKPDDIDLLLLRVRLRFMTGELADVAELNAIDIQAADRAATPQADSRATIGEGYAVLVEQGGKTNLYDRAIAQYDLWLKYHPDDHRVPDALNGRCYLRAVAGRDLDQALADCNRSLRLRPKAAATLDSRGLVQLRRGALAEAIADYDAALAIQPKIAISLYARGVAKQRKGDSTGGDADIAAAVAIKPEVAKTFSDFGIGPAAAAATKVVPPAR
jgi:tetratricopeptide (TPR) repeat protein